MTVRRNWVRGAQDRGNHQIHLLGIRAGTGTPATNFSLAKAM
jgi:hypothetical protein